jgi:hypothetical protein
MSEDEYIHSVQGPENYRTTVDAPLVRAVTADAIVKILIEHADLNSANPETSFYLYDPKLNAIPSVGFAKGTSDMGVFMVFPKEANKKPLKQFSAKIAFTHPVEGQSEIAIQNDDSLPNAAIAYTDYLIVDPKDWNDVKRCKNINEADAVLFKKYDKSRDQREQEFIEEAKEYVALKTKIDGIIKDGSNQALEDQKNWEAFYTRFCLPHEDQTKTEYAHKEARKEYEMLQKIRAANPGSHQDTIWRSSSAVSHIENLGMDELRQMDQFLTNLQTVNSKK